MRPIYRRTIPEDESVSLHQNKSANNRQFRDFAISRDEGKVLRRCKQIFRTNGKAEGKERQREGGGGGDRAEEGGKLAKKPNSLLIFRKIVPIVSTLIPSNYRGMANRTLRSRTFGAGRLSSA